MDNRTTVIITGDVDYTHYVCHTCEKVLYCSKAIPFDPQTDYGWCPHMLEEADAHVWTDPPLNGWYHKCEPASADGYKLYLPYHQ